MSTEMIEAAAPAPLRVARAERTWEGPTRRQRAYIARLSLELLGIPYPADEAEASRVIDRLKRGVEAASVDGGTDEIPF